MLLSTALIYSRKESNVAEPAKDKKVSIRKIMDEIEEDDGFSDEERKAFEEELEVEYREWRKQQAETKGA
jgi:hypothetical protein